MQASLTNRARWPSWLAAALVAVIMAIWWRPWVDDAVAPAPAAAAAAAPAPAPAPAIAERMPSPNLSSRAATPTEVATPAPALKLVGTVLGGAGNFATVLRRTDSQPLLLRVGDRVDGLTVAAIEPDRVVLAGAAKPIVIKADSTVAVSAPPVLSPAVSPLSASQVEPPAYAEGEAPWDAGANFRH